MIIASLSLATLLSSCALITTPVKVIGKAATTSIGLAGKTAGAGINALSSKPSKSSDPSDSEK